jgi:hypothetical protein
VPASEGLEPRLGGVWFDVAEAVRKRRRTPFQLSKNPFDSVPISVATHLKSEACSAERRLEMVGAIDEKHGSFDIVFLAEFREEHLSESGRGRRKEADVKQVVCLGIASGVQPVLLVVDSNHRFVERDLIRTPTRFGL